MTILSSEIKFYKAATVSDTSANGGRMSATTYTTGVVQNVFPNVLSSERTIGSTKYRKVFCKVANDDDETLYSPTFKVFAPTAGDDWVVFFAGTQTDTQADITGSEQIYGSSTLVSHSGTTLVVDVENSSLTGMFTGTDTIYVTDKAKPLASTGNEETATVSSVNSVAGARVTMTLSSALTNTYSAGATVSTVYEPSDIVASSDNWSESGSFTYDEASYPLVVDNIGTVEETWTLTFLTASTFTVSGATLGSVGSGNITTDFEPSNPDFTKPYFTLLSGGWGGTAVAGNTVTFTTSPASVALWEKRVVPASCSSITGNNVYLVGNGETV